MAVATEFVALNFKPGVPEIVAPDADPDPDTAIAARVPVYCQKLTDVPIAQPASAIVNVFEPDTGIN